MITETSRPPEARVFVAPLFLLRVPCLPVSAVAALRMPEHEARLRRLEALDAELAAEGAPITEALFQLVPQLSQSDGELRRRVASLLALKRAVYRGSPPKDGRVLDDVAPLLPVALRARLEGWLALAHERQRLTAALATGFDRELAHARDGLKDCLRHAELRRGIQVASPTFERFLDRFLARDSQAPDHRDRVSESSGTQYVYRASCKTSPFSTLGAVVPGLWRDDEGAPGVAAPLQLADARRGRVRINVALVARVLETLTARAIARGTARVVLNPTVRVAADRAHFVRRRANALQNVAAIDALVAHSSFSLPASPLLASVMAQLRAGGATVAQLSSALARLHAQSPEACRIYLERLIEYGILLCPDARVPPHAPDPAQAALEPLRPAAGDEPSLLALDEATALATEIEGGDLETRRRAAARLEALFGALAPRDNPSLSSHSTIFYEDTTFPAARLTQGKREHAERIATLATLQRVLPLFDPLLPLRIAMKEFFKLHHGGSGALSDVVAFALRFTRECAAPFSDVQKEAPWPQRLFDAALLARGGPDTQAVRRALVARRRALRRLRARARRCAPGATLRIAERELATLAAAAPLRSYPLLSSSFLVQETASRQWVINKVYGGLGQMMSRFLYLWDDHDETQYTAALRRYLETVTPPGCVLAELQGGYDTNLNLHAPLTDYEIALPGERSARHPDQIIQLADLQLCYDAAADELHLRSRRLSRRVIPVYLGTLVSGLLSDLHQFLLCFSPLGGAMWPDWQSLVDGAPDHVVHHPRLVVGSVVLLRATWGVPAQLLPARAKGEHSALFHGRLRHALTALGIPEKSFARLGGSLEERKPLYFDLGSWLSVQVLEKKLARASGQVWFTEVLPAHEEAAVEIGGQRHVAEQVIELTTTFQGHHAE